MLIQTPPIFHIPRPARFVRYLKARLHRPQIEPETVSQLLGYYGLELTGPPGNLPFGRRNNIVVIHTNQGKKVLKLYQERWQTPAIQYEHSILCRLAALNFFAPRLVAAPDGETLVRAGSQRCALFDYVEGTTFSSCFIPRFQRTKLLARAGKTLARFHRQLAGFLPAGRHHLGYRSYSEDRWRDLAWHIAAIDSLVEKSQSWTRAADQIHLDWLAAQKNYLAESLCRLEEALNNAPLPRLVIHGDYGLHNLQFQADDRVTVHDFELARLEWRLIDLIILLSRLPFKRSRSLVAAYLADFPLSAEEWQLLPQVWQLYKLQGAIQYWHTFFAVGGQSRLVDARKRIEQADWAVRHRAQVQSLKEQAA